MLFAVVSEDPSMPDPEGDPVPPQDPTHPPVGDPQPPLPDPELPPEHTPEPITDPAPPVGPGWALGASHTPLAAPYTATL